MSIIKKIKIFFLSLIYFFYKELSYFINDTKNIVKLYLFVHSNKNLSFKRFIKSNTKVFKNFNSNKKKKLYFSRCHYGSPWIYMYTINNF